MPHVSFSEVKNWHQCPFYHKLTYVDRVKLFEGNEFTAFGKAVHSTCEEIFNAERTEEFDLELFFKKHFLQELKDLPSTHKKKVDLIRAMKDQGVVLVEGVLSAVHDYFGEDVEILAVEESLMEEINDFTDAKYNFKGFIDAVFKTSDGKYHIVDWKTCGWGWDRTKRNDKMTTYQLTFYKYFYALKHNIDPQKIETHFALLKRTAKKNHVELFRVTSGHKKTQNAIKLLTKALYNINRKKYFKNRLACGKCEFNNTKHCP
jgi:ATP-dependent exoDNAse (exonuclease V) beta subunit